MRSGVAKQLGMCMSLLWALCGGASADEVPPLPQPLTLDYALSLVDEAHPSLQQALAEKRSAEAKSRGSEAADDFSLSLEARARWVQPPSGFGDELIEDHKASLFLRKPLFDFGRTASTQQATSMEAQAMGQRYLSQRDQRRLAIMRAYFDVLLADQENFRDNEALAISYIALDRLRNRQELGQVSDIEILEQESGYQSVRHQLQGSQSRQRLTRERLANLLNRPGQLPADVAPPEFQHERKLPEYEPLLQLALEHNPAIKALELQLGAAQQRVEAARSETHPRLDAELEASEYSRELGSSDTLRAGVTLTLPIYNGDRVDSAVATEQAAQQKAQASLDEAKYELREALLESWLALQELAVEREQAQAELDYRELYLDRSRANYEMEVAADLGDAMVRLSDANLALFRNDIDTALAWERLRALSGGELEQPAVADKQP